MIRRDDERGGGGFPDDLASIEDLPELKVADEDPDPRGWDLVAGDGRRFGAVTDLIVDLESMKVRYLVCAADASDPAARRQAFEPSSTRKRGSRHVLVPLGYARLDSHGHRVLVDTVTSAELDRMPPFEGLPLDGGTVEAVSRAFAGDVRGPEGG